MKQVRVITALTLAAALTGCASMNNEPMQQPRAAAPDPAVVALANAANRIQRSAVELKQVQSAAKLANVPVEQLRAKAASETQVPPGLGTVITIEGYDGPFTNLVEAVARSNGWNYLVEGVRPPVIQVIHKKYSRVRAIDVLRDVGYSVTGATLVLDPVNKNIIVRFI